MIRNALTLCAALALTACGGGAGSSPFEAAPVPTPGCTPRVTTVSLSGDSTQYGTDDAREVQTVWPGARLQADMDARFGAGAVVVTNYGDPGTTSYDAQQRPADVRVANYGINDMRLAGDTAALFGARMAALNLTLVETQNPVVWGSTRIPADATYNEAGYVTADKALGLPVADVYSYVKSLPDWRQHLVDGVHPDSALYALIVDNVLAPAVADQVAPLRCMEVSHG